MISSGSLPSSTPSTLSTSSLSSSINFIGCRKKAEQEIKIFPMTDETTTMTIRRRRTETTQSSVKLLKEDDNDDGNTNTNDVKYEHNNDYPSNSNSHSNFFDDWGQGNWCWERDYNKYPVSFPSHNNRNCHNANDGINSRSSKRTIKEESCDDEQCGDDDVQLGDDNDIDDDEKKPAAIKCSSFTDSADRVTTTASSEMDMTKTKREETRKISRGRNSQIKVENKNEENHTNDYINSSVNYSNNENNDDSDDSSFYDDWVEGNWCLLDKYDKSNNSGSGDSNNPSRERRHGIRTTRSRKDTRVDNNNSNNDNKSAKIDLKRSRYDDDEDDEESDCEDNNDDNEEVEEEEEEFLPEDNNDAGNYRANKRPARKKKSRRRIQYEQVWMNMFQKLVMYKKQHKNTLVPQRYNDNPRLGRWVNTQRQNYKNDDVLPNRLALLKSIDFEWDGENHDELWMGMYQKLAAYKEMHKNSMVPFRYQKNSKLGNWVSKQRKEYKNEELLPKRVDLLKSIGFEWDGAKVNYDERWMGMFQKLVAYKDMHKNSMVPSCYQEDPKLGHWVLRQRREYKNKELLSKRVDLLKSIDFEWVCINSVKRKKSPG